jgi:hypothetical protein
MQLSQPIRGVHPGESGTSILDYYLQHHATVPEDLGIFLPNTNSQNTKCKRGRLGFLSIGKFIALRTVRSYFLGLGIVL